MTRPTPTPASGTSRVDAPATPRASGPPNSDRQALGPAAAAFTDLTGQLVDERYRVVKRVGEGGMCLVYLADDTSTGDRVAIKILLPALLDDPIAMARLRREAALGGQVRHPNVCHIIRQGVTSAGHDYIVMPFVEGELLCDRTRLAGQLPLDVTAAFLRDMCAGLHVAHQVGIIHRDLKPENIMIVADTDGTEHAVVMDFSLATGPNALPLTGVGLVVGTPEFMSPEQLRGLELDHRSDIYSLAFMVYEMLTGQLPFNARTQQEIMIARLKGESIPIRTKRPDLNLPEAVEHVLAKALASDSDRRYKSALEFGEAFSRAAEGSSAQRAALAGGLMSRIRNRFRRRVAKGS